MLQEETLEMPPYRLETNEKAAPTQWERFFQADYLGMGGSILCLIHCIAPQVLILSSLGLGMSTFFESESWNLFFWLTCTVAVWLAVRRSAVQVVKILLWLSLVVFSVGLGYEVFTGASHLISYIGSSGLIVSHIVNLVVHNRRYKVGSTPLQTTE